MEYYNARLQTQYTQCNKQIAQVKGEDDIGESTVMDSMFGITAVRDTRAMVLARYKNKTQQMLLDKQNRRLQNEFKHRITKLDLELGDFREFYRNSYSSQRAVICPRGLSFDQKQNFRKIRQNNQPSISLNEFDNRIDDYKRKMKLRRYGDSHLVPALCLDHILPCDWCVPSVYNRDHNDATNKERYIPLLPRNRTFIPHEILYGSKITFRREKTNLYGPSSKSFILDFHRLKFTQEKI